MIILNGDNFYGEHSEVIYDLIDKTSNTYEMDEINEILERMNKFKENRLTVTKSQELTINMINKLYQEYFVYYEFGSDDSTIEDILILPFVITPNSYKILIFFKYCDLMLHEEATGDYVVKILTSDGSNETFSDEFVISQNQISNLTATVINENKILIAYSNDEKYKRGECLILNINEDEMSITNEPFIFEPNEIGNLKAITLNENNEVLLAYTKYTNVYYYNNGIVQSLIINENTLSKKDEIIFNNADTEEFTILGLTDKKSVIVFNDINKGKIVILHNTENKIYRSDKYIFCENEVSNITYSLTTSNRIILSFLNKTTENGCSIVLMVDENTENIPIDINVFSGLINVFETDTYIEEIESSLFGYGDVFLFYKDLFNQTSHGCIKLLNINGSLLLSTENKYIFANSLSKLSAADIFSENNIESLISYINYEENGNGLIESFVLV